MSNKRNDLKIGKQQRWGAQPWDEPIQGPQQSQGRVNQDLGREDARQLRESQQRFPRQVDKPNATTSKELLQETLNRQQLLQQDAQEQVRRTRQRPSTRQQTPTQPRPNLQPSGNFKAPMVPTIKNGSVVLTQQPRTGLGAALIGASLDAFGNSEMGQQFGDWVWNNTFQKFINAVTGDTATIEELRERDEFRLAYTEQMNLRDASNQRTYEQGVVEANRPIAEGEAPAPPTLPEPEFPDEPTQQVVQQQQTQVQQSQPVFQPPQSRLTETRGSIRFTQQPVAPPSYSPANDPRNAAYIAARDALGPNATQQEMDAVRDQGLATWEEIHGRK
jgi:hypothetical protein